MNYKTLEVIPKEKYTKPFNFKEIMNNIYEFDRYLEKNLIEFEEDVSPDNHDFVIIKDSNCPNKCFFESRQIYRSYISTVNNRRVLDLKCINCGQSYILLQEISEE